MAVARDRKGSAVRTGSRGTRVCSIAAPLLVVATSFDDGAIARQLFGLVPDVTMLGVFGSAPPAEPSIDLRGTGDARDTAASEPITVLSLGRTPGERTRTTVIAGQIGDAIAESGAATVAIALGLRGDHQEASDAALLARRKARSRIGWIVFLDGTSDPDAGRIARRRMQLFVRGIRLEPVAVAEAPMGTNARFWQIRAQDR